MTWTGIFPNVSHAEYHAPRIGVVSKSALDLIDRSPLHYKAWIDGEPEESTPALEFGAAFHCAVLEPERFAKEYATEPDFGDCRKKENKAARDAWRDEHQGRTLIPLDDEATIKRMTAALRSHPLTKKMLREGEPELTVRWEDEETSLQCKCRADFYVRRLGMVLDLKSTMDARPAAFKKDVAKYRYHWQDALYREGFAAVDAPVGHFVFAAVEKVTPHAVAIYALDANAQSLGFSGVRRTMDRMAECVHSGKWPGYSTSIESIELPPWAA